MAVAHVVGGLSVDEGRRFRAHLLECPSCRARVGELRAIAHDLADVERDEQRQRAAKRTDTKEREGSDDQPPPAPPTRLSGRTTLVVAAGLVVLMALSAWNFLLRGRLQEADVRIAGMRESTIVLRDGQRWRTVTATADGVAGQVTSSDDAIVVVVDGLADRGYGLYLLDAEDVPVFSTPLVAVDGVVHDFVLDDPVVDRVQRVLLTRDGEMSSQPSGRKVFEAVRRSSGDDAVPEIEVRPVEDSTP